ncbi:MAG: site-specific integrase [Anaerolineales bacterium]|nr:site-specific integrase [Anaerolineales bacterium]
MNTQSAIIENQLDYQQIIILVLDGLNSENSKRAYEKGLSDFLYWWAAKGKPMLSKAVIQRYKTVLQDKGLSPSTINLRLSSIRKLAQEGVRSKLRLKNVGSIFRNYREKYNREGHPVYLLCQEIPHGSFIFSAADA